MRLEDWFAPPQVRSLELSPDGSKLVGISGGLPIPFLQDVDSGKTTVLSLAGRALPTSIEWITDDLLAVDLLWSGAIAIDLKGRMVDGLGRGFVRTLPAKGAGDLRVLVHPSRGDGLETIDLRSGKRSTHRPEVPGEPNQYGVDDDGVLRLVSTVETPPFGHTTVRNWYRADERSEWELLEEGSLADDLWQPAFVLPEPHQIAVFSRKDRDTFALFRYDTSQRRIVELMAGHPQQDIALGERDEGGYFKRVATSGIKPQTHWFDARWAAVQRAVDEALPGHVNVLSGDPDKRVLVASDADVDPGRWYVLDTRTWKMREVAEVRPRIDPRRMRPMETVQYPARDGLVINAYLTRPAQTVPAPAPTVVLVHGGPFVRDHWGWDLEVQLLAAQGYVVFQPQFRGSTGFGRRFAMAGYRQFGRAMQDDITDGVHWLLAQGIADRDRICIYGASYGGYAALWGVIKTPELYRCGASMAGVSDLADFAGHSWLDDSNARSREFHRMVIGDPDKDRALLDEVSPLRHVDRVRVPLFIAHGEQDKRVLFSQSKRMVDALKERSKPVEWLPLENEGHAIERMANRMRYYRALLAFLQKHIGGAPVPAPASAEAKP
jgi:dipeptidyl aminopeptidase/acylaminoacyl peptidase